MKLRLILEEANSKLGALMLQPRQSSAEVGKVQLSERVELPPFSEQVVMADVTDLTPMGHIF